MSLLPLRGCEGLDGSMGWIGVPQEQWQPTPAIDKSLFFFQGHVVLGVPKPCVFQQFFAQINKTHWYFFKGQMQTVSTPVFAWISRPSFKNMSSILSNM